MKEDRRIVKTKRELKRALIELLKEKPFERVSVKEICERSSTSRITFYAHYKDKYELLNDLFADFSERVQTSCSDDFECGDSREDVVVFLKKLLHSVIGCVYENSFLVKVINSAENPYLAFAFKCYITDVTEKLLELLSQKFKCKYTSAEASAFVRGGFVSLFSAAFEAACSREALEKKIGRLIEDLVRSDVLFVHE